MTDPNIWSPDSSSALAGKVAAFYKGNSTTSNSIQDFGTKTFVTEPGKYWEPGDWVVTVDKANKDNWMNGQVVSYDTVTGTLVFAPEVSSGTGTKSNWHISISGVWVPIGFTGGTVPNATTFSNTVGFNGATNFAALATFAEETVHAKTINSVVGNTNLSSHATLADADAVLSFAQIFNTTLVMNPTAARILTLPSAADIIAGLGAGVEIGNNFDFTVINDSINSITLAGNSGVVQLGKTLFKEGSAEFRVTVDSLTIVSIANKGSPIEKVGAGDISTGAVQSASSDITLDINSARLQSITMTTEGNFVILPSATTLPISSPVFVLNNEGFYPFGIKDSTGNILTVIAGGGNTIISLVDNTTIAGNWLIGGDNLKGGLITFNGLLSSSFDSSNLFDMCVQLSDNITAHFAAITSNGLAVFIVDGANRVIGAPVTISTTANMRPCAAFKIDANSFIVFYSSSTVTNTLFAVVITISGTVPTVNTPASITGASYTVGVDDGIAEPKIAQLDTTLYLVAFCPGASGIANNVVGVQISSGITVTFGTAVSVAGGNTNAVQAQVVFPLTITTGLLLYKTGTSSPYQGRAVVVSVTNANPPVCTVNTNVATLQSKSLNAPACNMLSATICALVDDNNVTNDATLILISTSGVTTTVNAPTTLDTGISGGLDYISNMGTRYIPHIYRVTDTSVLWWGMTSAGVSHLVIASCVYPTITAGTKLVESFSIATGTTKGAGRLIGFGPTDILAGIRVGPNSSGNGDIAIVPHKISGNTLVVGKSMRLTNLFDDVNDVMEYSGVRLPNGLYAIAGFPGGNVPLGGSVGLQIVKSDGVSIVDKGIIADYAASSRGTASSVYLSAFLTALTNSRLVLLSATQEKSPTTRLIRVTNINLLS